MLLICWCCCAFQEFLSWQSCTDTWLMRSFDTSHCDPVFCGWNKINCPMMLSWSSLNASANWTWLCPAETVSELYFCRYQIVACLALVCDINTVCWHQSPMSVEGFQVYYCPLVLMLIDVTHYKVKLNLTQSSCSCCTNHFEKIFSNYDLVLNVQQFLKCLGRQSDTFWKFQWAVCVEPIAAKMLFSILSCWRWNVTIAESFLQTAVAS